MGMEKVLNKLFGSQPVVKLLKVLFRNPDFAFSEEEIEGHTKLKKRIIEKNIKNFLSIGMLERKIRIDVVQDRYGKRKTQKVKVYSANPTFELYHELRGLMMKLASSSNKKLVTDIQKLGRVKLAVASGFFINNPLSRIDLLIVGDNLDRKKLSGFLSRLELETGKTISYSVMNSDEFQYRMNMFDRFLRDILEFPHQKIINKVNL